MRFCQVCEVSWDSNPNATMQLHLPLYWKHRLLFHTSRLNEMLLFIDAEVIFTVMVSRFHSNVFEVIPALLFCTLWIFPHEPLMRGLHASAISRCTVVPHDSEQDCHHCQGVYFILYENIGTQNLCFATSYVWFFRDKGLEPYISFFSLL